MQVEFRKTFKQDLRDIKDRKVLERIRVAIEEVETANSLLSVANVKAIQGHVGYYRIRIGDFRLGLYIEPIWYLAYMLQAFQVSRFRPFWYTKPHDPIKSLNCRINGGLKAIYFVQKDTKWVL